MTTSGSGSSSQSDAQHYNDRWSTYEGNPGITSISRRYNSEQLKKFDIFSGYDDDFLEEISADITFVKWKGNTVLFEEGSYIDLAFYIVEGKVEVYLDKLQNAGSLQKPIYHAGQTIVETSGTRGGTSNDPPRRSVLDENLARMDKGPPQVTYLATMDVNIEGDERFVIEAQEFFGEIGALNGWPQSVTARTLGECTLCQIRLPALRKMRERSDALKEKLDSVYRRRLLFSQLQGTPLFQKCSPQLITQLMQNVELVSLAPGKALCEEGREVDAFYLVRSGFLRLSQQFGEGKATLSYLSKGNTFGEIELLLEGMGKWLFSASSVGYSELVKINRNDFMGIVRTSPDSEKQMWQYAVERIKRTGYVKRHVDQSELIDFSLEKGLVQGNSILLIDLETCVRCDDCVRGCADTHGGRPRFVREGEKYGKFLITRSCYHCEDPVCLIGCPTGAIRRAQVGDVVEINERICIGCSNCANRCPYDAIVMHETGDDWAEDAYPIHLRGKPQLVASKCDLCYSSSSGPACVRNCPQGSAVRIQHISDLQTLLSKG